MKNIQATIVDIITTRFPNINSVSIDIPLQEQGFDSMSIIQLVIILENYYSFEFAPENLSYETLRTISSISECIYQKIKEKTL